MIHKFRLIRNGKIVGYEQHILRPQCGDDNLNVICVCYSTPKQLENPRHYPRCSCFDKADFIFHDHKDMFTGLHDSEGQEIYEGDVVEDNCNEVGGRYLGSRILRITFMDGCFSAESRHNAVCLYEMTPGTFLKVIGNIHEEAQNE